MSCFRVASLGCANKEVESMSEEDLICWGKTLLIPATAGRLEPRPLGGRDAPDPVAEANSAFSLKLINNLKVETCR